MASLSREPSSQPSIKSNKSRRQASVYDAVAGIPPQQLYQGNLSLMRIGRVSSRGFLLDTPTTTKNRDTINSSSVAVPPEEVLFRRSGAPERYEEDDYYYWADRHLKDEQKLPDSDLLQAIHAYASDFYENATHDKGLIDFASMDETALLAIGILLEEATAHCLGDTGDMVFVEGEAREPDENLRGSLSEIRTRPGSATTLEYTSRRRRKRRKTRHDIEEST